MPLSFPLHPLVVASPIAGAAAVMAWRISEARRPLTTARILAPPLGMATGLAMFALPVFRLPLAWAAAALALGAVVFAWPVLRATRLHVTPEGVMLRRSYAFFAILAALVAVRLLLREQVGHALEAARTSSLFYLLALGTIARWRWAMWREYRRLAGSRGRASLSGG